MLALNNHAYGISRSFASDDHYGCRFWKAISFKHSATDLEHTRGTELNFILN